MPKKPLPDFVAPMQASFVKEPFDSMDWIFETKLDGYRAIAVIDSTGRLDSGPVTDYRLNRSSRPFEIRLMN
jgi:hypothetical protein